jgi:hypothetical protein
MFQVSRNPNWGFYINMFSRVAVNVLKVSKGKGKGHPITDHQGPRGV